MYGLSLAGDPKIAVMLNLTSKIKSWLNREICCGNLTKNTAATQKVDVYFLEVFLPLKVLYRVLAYSWSYFMVWNNAYNVQTLQNFRRKYDTRKNTLLYHLPLTITMVNVQITILWL